VNKNIEQVKSSKNTYRVKNWTEYNKSLIQRGSLTLWISEDIKDWWYGKGHNTYSDKAIEIMLSFQAIHKLPLRASQGFVESIFKLAGINLSVPDYTTISRRAEKINVTLRVTPKEVTDMIVDSTGLKVFGEGEWKVRKHGYSKRRTWKKLHIGIESKGEARTMMLTGNNVCDSDAVAGLLNQEKAQINDFYGDGAYDMRKVYKLLISKEVTGFHIPPKKTAVINNDGSERDKNLMAIQQTSGDEWKNSSGYHKRSLVETFMFRYKQTFGDRMSFRTDERQKNEALVKCNILNIFHSLGVPESYVVT
jgi:hypothetical protein